MSQGKATNKTAAIIIEEEDPWQTAAQSRNQQPNNNQEPSSWSERPPWLSSKTSSQQQQHPVTWNERSLQQQQREAEAAGAGSDDTAWTRHVVQSWHVIDGIAGLLWLLYALLLCQARHHKGDDPAWTLTTGWHIIMITTWYLAGVLLLRTLMGGIAMSLDWWDRCGLRWSSLTSILLGMTWLVVSLYSFFGKKRMLNWLDLHYHTLLWSSDVWHLIKHTPVLLWIFPLVACKLELLRWYMVQRYYRLLQDANHSNPIHQPRRTRRPWWWQSSRSVMDDNIQNNASYMDPLLPSNGGTESQQNRSTTNQSGGGWFSFGGWFGGSGGDALRDDGSVEYASISEDWASRSEEDPLWWSRDEEMRTPQRMKEPKTHTHP